MVLFVWFWNVVVCHCVLYQIHYRFLHVTALVQGLVIRCFVYLLVPNVLMETISVHGWCCLDIPNVGLALRTQNCVGLRRLLLNICKIEIVLLLLQRLTSYVSVLWRTILWLFTSLTLKNAIDPLNEISCLCYGRSRSLLVRYGFEFSFFHFLHWTLFVVEA